MEIQTIYFKNYKTEYNTIGTAYYNDKDGLHLKAKNPYESHRVNHIAVLNGYKYKALKIGKI